MVKIIGIIIVILSSTMVGYKMSDNLSLRVTMLKKIKKTIIQLRGEIRYNNTAMPEAFKVIGRRADKPLDDFLINVSNEMDKMEGKTLSDIWKENMHIIEQCGIDKNDIERLGGLGDNLGFLDREMQLSHLDLYLENLENDISDATTKVNNNSRLYKCLGVMGGLLITLLIV